jgi:hypothetical protein
LCDVYAEVSGRAPGEGMGVLRDIIIADTDAEAHAIWHESGYFCGANGFCRSDSPRGWRIRRPARRRTYSRTGSRLSARLTL